MSEHKQERCGVALKARETVHQCSRKAGHDGQHYDAKTNEVWGLGSSPPKESPARGPGAEPGEGFQPSPSDPSDSQVSGDTGQPAPPPGAASVAAIREAQHRQALHLDVDDAHRAIVALFVLTQQNSPRGMPLPVLMAAWALCNKVPVRLTVGVNRATGMFVLAPKLEREPTREELDGFVKGLELRQSLARGSA